MLKRRTCITMKMRLLPGLALLASLVAQAAPPQTPPVAFGKLGRSAAGVTKLETEKPYRVLVVIGDQWDDPGSYCIDTQSRFYDLRARQSGKDFLDVVTMLKIWGIPFDVLRLDQQRLQINRFLNGVAEPNYRCVIWMADPDELQGYSAHYETLRRVVEDYGIHLIALFDHIRAPAVAELVGIEIEGAAAARTDAAMTIDGEHFITAGMVGTTLSGEGASKPRIVLCRPRPGTQVLGELQGQPQLVVRAVNDRTRAVWIGGGNDWFDKVPAMRQLFRNAMVWCMDYCLFNDNFENAFIFVMDDMGCSEHAYSLAWHYPTPSKEDIIKYLVEPLAKHGLVMVQNLTPGYANPVTRMVENPWTVPKFTDPFGNVQDYGSTKVGLDEGVRRGVFEIHAHRAWTHLNWDLDSPPGSWWDAPLEGERAHTDWYNETVDTRRGLPVPSNDQLFLYKIGRDAIERQFGVTPLGVTVRPGAGLEHDNGRLAAIAGYGVGRWHYLGPDRVIQLSILAMAPEEFSCHDLDLVEKTGPELKTPTQAERERNPALYRSTRVVGGRVIDLRDPNWIGRWKHKRWIGFNEYCAYLHSRIEGPVSAGLRFDIDYDAHYCRHFAKNSSKWTLELSDDYLRKATQGAAVSVDGKAAQPVLAHRTLVTIPPGVGRHRVEVRTEKENERRPTANRMTECRVEHVTLVYAPESESIARDIAQYAAKCNDRLAQWFQPASPVAQKVYWMARKNWRKKPETYGFPYAGGADAYLPASDVDLPTQLTYIADSMAISDGGPPVDRMARFLQLPSSAGPREVHTQLKQSREFFLVFTANFILPHELTHGFCNDLDYPQQPRWYYEGIAQWAAYKIHGQLRSPREADMIDQYYQLLWQRATGLKVRDFARADELGAAGLDTANYAWYHGGLLQMFRQLEEMKGGELLPELLRVIGQRHRGNRNVPHAQMIETFSEVVGQDLKPWFRERWNLGD